MMANAMDEGIRNAVAVGADPDRMAGVDNFCWERFASHQVNNGNFTAIDGIAEQENLERG